MFRPLIGKLFSSSISICRQNLATRFLSMSTNGSSTTPSLLIPSISTLSPLVYSPRNESIKEINLGLWKTPRLLPSSAIIPVENDPLIFDIQNPDLPKVEKQAARMIIIRRRKMKKHKLRKLRKRRKFEYRRVALKRKTQKEKLFQAKLASMVKEAQKFDAAAYVEEMIQKSKEEFVDTRPPRNPRLLKNPALHVNGVRIPPFNYKRS